MHRRLVKTNTHCAAQPLARQSGDRIRDIACRPCRRHQDAAAWPHVDGAFLARRYAEMFQNFLTKGELVFGRDGERGMAGFGGVEREVKSLYMQTAGAFGGSL